MGRLDEAHIDLENVVRHEPTNADANMLYSMINTLQVDTSMKDTYEVWTLIVPFGFIAPFGLEYLVSIKIPGLEVNSSSQLWMNRVPR